MVSKHVWIISSLLNLSLLPQLLLLELLAQNLIILTFSLCQLLTLKSIMFSVQLSSLSSGRFFGTSSLSSLSLLLTDSVIVLVSHDLVELCTSVVLLLNSFLPDSIDL